LFALNRAVREPPLQIKARLFQAQKIADRLRPLKPALSKELEILIQRMSKQQSKK
jgi:hypothetical protein